MHTFVSAKIPGNQKTASRKMLRTKLISGRLTKSKRLRKKLHQPRNERKRKPSERYN